jgi:hypothetical protein
MTNQVTQAVFFKTKPVIKWADNLLAKIISKAYNLRKLGADVSGVTLVNEVALISINRVEHSITNVSKLNQINRKLDVLADEMSPC